MWLIQWVDIENLITRNSSNPNGVDGDWVLTWVTHLAEHIHVQLCFVLILSCLEKESKLGGVKIRSFWVRCMRYLFTDEAAICLLNYIILCVEASSKADKPEIILPGYNYNNSLNCHLFDDWLQRSGSVFCGIINYYIFFLLLLSCVRVGQSISNPHAYEPYIYTHTNRRFHPFFVTDLNDG